MSSWVTSWINSLALVWLVHMVRPLQQDSCHTVMKNITDTSYLIGDGTGRGSANAQYFVFEVR